MLNPFVTEGKRLDPRDLKNALSDIGAEILPLMELIDKSERTGRVDDEIQMVLALSGLEIKMSNFAKAMREKFL